MQNQIFIELGSGGRRLPGFTTIDRYGDCDIKIDIANTKLPFPDDSVSLIYSSHVLEHFSFPEPMMFVLKECLRVLKPSGKFSISVPNARMFIEAYLNKEPYPDIAVYEPAYHYNTHIDYVNYVAYMNGHHKHLFDIENLLKILELAGFVKCKERIYDPALDPGKSRKHHSIYANAFKAR